VATAALTLRLKDTETSLVKGTKRPIPVQPIGDAEENPTPVVLCLALKREPDGKRPQAWMLISSLHLGEESASLMSEDGDERRDSNVNHCPCQR